MRGVLGSKAAGDGVGGAVASGRSAASGAVDAEAGWCGVVAGPGALEAERLAAAGGDGGVVAEVGGRHVRSALRDGGVPRVGYLLIAGEGEGHRPAADRRGAGVADGDVSGEAAGPLVLGVGDVAAPAPAAPADGPGEGG